MEVNDYLRNHFDVFTLAVRRRAGADRKIAILYLNFSFHFLKAGRSIRFSFQYILRANRLHPWILTCNLISHLAQIFIHGIIYFRLAIDDSDINIAVCRNRMPLKRKWQVKVDRYYDIVRNITILTEIISFKRFDSFLYSYLSEYGIHTILKY